MAPLNNCNKLGPLSACVKEVRNREVITPPLLTRRLWEKSRLLACGSLPQEKQNFSLKKGNQILHTIARAVQSREGMKLLPFSLCGCLCS
jgi:hypothetical protein